MKIYSLLFIILVVGMTSCYDEPDLLSEVTTTEGKLFPVISSFGTESGETTFNSGAAIGLDLRYWSVDEIDQISMTQEIDGVATVISTSDYTQNFAEDSQTDKLVVSYTAPAVSAETAVTITAEVLNVNGLNRTRTLSLTILP